MITKATLADQARAYARARMFKDDGCCVVLLHRLADAVAGVETPLDDVEIDAGPDAAAEILTLRRQLAAARDAALEEAAAWHEKRLYEIRYHADADETYSPSRWKQIDLHDESAGAIRALKGKP